MKKNTKKVINGALATAMLTTVATPALAANADANKLYKDAYDAVIAAQQSGSQESINVARNAIKLLAGTDAAFAIGEFSKQVDSLQQKLFVEFMDILFDNNNSPVEKIGQAQINKARALVLSFDTFEGNKPYTASWSSAVDKYQQDNINVTTAAVEKAEATTTTENIEKAKTLVAELSTVENNETVKTYAQGLKERVEKLSAELTVAEISSTNNKEVTVRFSKEVDKETAENLANYKFTTKGQAKLTGGKATLSEDGRTVVLTLATEAKNQETAEIEVSNVKDLDGKAVTKAKKEVMFFDSKAPTVENLTVVGPKEIEIEFSEPLKTAPTVLLDNGQVSSTVNHTAGSNKVTVKFGLNLSEGDHTVTVEGGVDYAGYKVVKANTEFNYKNNTEEVSAEVVKANQTEVTVKFNKPVKIKTASKVKVFHTYNNSASYKGTIESVDAVDGYSDTYVLKFTTPMADRADNKIFINTEKDVFEDRWGNDVNSLELNTEVKVDNKAPEVAEIKAVEDKKITVKFNEKVNAADAINNSNYVLKKADGTELTNKEYSFLTKDGEFNGLAKFTYSADKQTVTIELPSALEGGNFNLTVSGIKDVSYNENKMTSQDVNFTVTDTTAPQIASVVKNGAKIRVAFSESMNTEGLTTLSNYELVNKTTGNLIKFHDDAEVKVVDGKTVEIDLVEAVDVATNELKVRVSGNLKDLAGNKINGVYTEKDVVEDAINADSIVDVYTESKTEISFVVDQELEGNLSPDNFQVGNVTDGIASIRYVNKDGKATITLTVKEGKELATDATPTITIKEKALTNRFETSNTVAIVTEAAKDKIAPEVLKITNADGEKVSDIRIIASNKIEIMFTEAMDMASISTQSFSVDGFTVTAFEGGASNKSVILTLKAENEEILTTGLTVTQNGAVEDIARNRMVDFKGKITSDKVSEAKAEKIAEINAELVKETPVIDGALLTAAGLDASKVTAENLATVIGTLKEGRTTLGRDLTAAEMQNYVNEAVK